MGSLSNFTLKDMYNNAYTQTLLFEKNIHSMDSRSWSVSYAYLCITALGCTY